ncbi:unnamed protein product [Symbiodinium sp. CCMP2592]|nr:unnamed protein product [Symbiodinium sp. CCMP2592]
MVRWLLLFVAWPAEGGSYNDYIDRIEKRTSDAIALHRSGETAKALRTLNEVRDSFHSAVKLDSKKPDAYVTFAQSMLSCNQLEVPMAMQLEVKQEKRKRERKGRRREAAVDGSVVPVVDDEDDDSDLDSPSKRPLHGDAPLSAHEIRELLFGHVNEMKDAWRSFQGRLDRVEAEQLQHGHEMINLRTRTHALERSSSSMGRQQEKTTKCLEDLTEDVKKMKVQIDDLQKKPPPLIPVSDGLPQHGASRPAVVPGHADPWAEYLRHKGGKDADAGGAIPRGDLQGDRAGDSLSEDEKRTLVVGGWARDTKRAIIEAESGVLFNLEGIKELIDVEKLAIYGPRRSVGMLKFQQREGESFTEVKNRMWGVIKLVANSKFELASTKEMGEPKNMWASFVKTKAAPKDGEFVLLSSGWVALEAVAEITGCTVDEAKSAFEKELDVFSKRCTGMDGKDSSCAIHRWGRVCCWNLGGQSLKMLDVAVADADVLLVQEVSRGKEGWDGMETDEYHWIVHRHRDQWRGTAVGIAKDRFDCVIRKVASSRGVWILARVHGLGRIVCGSIHCFTGVTNSRYQSAVGEFFALLPAEWRKYPLVCGVDANEELCWAEHERSEELEIGHCSENLNVLLDEAGKRGCFAIAPVKSQKNTPTHYPRDETREGRQIDLFLGKDLRLGTVHIDPERRYTINSDHALLHTEITVCAATPDKQWGNDSRARWVHHELPDVTIVDDADVAELARKYTKPRASQRYRDSDETKRAIKDARVSNSKACWKQVHRLRRRDRHAWEERRLSRILLGGWDEFRVLQNEKKKRRGWWGGMLDGKSSAAVTEEVQAHLSEKMVCPELEDWDVDLDHLICDLPSRDDFVGFTLQDVRTELQQMKCRSAVGPDGISVHLLREMSTHETLGEQLLHLINHIVETQETPEIWNVSFLALLAKCAHPLKPNDLRPICVSSAFNKLVNRLVCARTLPLLRRGSKISACGRGRQAADLIGGMSRIRDVIHEWRMPALVCKLDVAGAFDRVDRRKMASLLIDRLRNKGRSSELRYLLGQLHSHCLEGRVPGGGRVRLHPNTGIKQGAPESAELFGILIDSMLSDLVECASWKKLGGLAEDFDVDLLFYQDDIFLVDCQLGRLVRRIRVVDRCLAQAGLKLATSKTKIIASRNYVGPRRAEVGGESFSVSGRLESIKVLGVSFNFFESPSQQAQEMLGRARAAVASHADILCASGPWMKKVDLLRSLVEGTWSWTAGALHWSAQDLMAANTLQLHTLRRMFALKRLRHEDWVSWNQRIEKCYIKAVILRLLSDCKHSAGVSWLQVTRCRNPRHCRSPRLPRRVMAPCLLWRALPCFLLFWDGNAWDEENETCGAHPETGAASSSSLTPSQVTSTPFCSQPWTYNQYVQFMAAAWDEEISVAVQMEDFDNLGHGDAQPQMVLLESPLPESVPTPFLPGNGVSTQSNDEGTWHYFVLSVFFLGTMDELDEFEPHSLGRPFFVCFVFFLDALDEPDPSMLYYLGRHFFACEHDLRDTLFESYQHDPFGKFA